MCQSIGRDNALVARAALLSALALTTLGVLARVLAERLLRGGIGRGRQGLGIPSPGLYFNRDLSR